MRRSDEEQNAGGLRWCQLFQTAPWPSLPSLQVWATLSDADRRVQEQRYEEEKRLLSASQGGEQRPLEAQELQGRQTGDEQWRRARGELGSSEPAPAAAAAAAPSRSAAATDPAAAVSTASATNTSSPTPAANDVATSTSTDNTQSDNPFSKLVNKP